MQPSSSNSPNPQMGWEAILSSLINLLEEKKANEVLYIDLANKVSYTGGFLIATGLSTRHLYALANYIIDFSKKNQIFIHHVEMTTDSGWILADLGEVIVHLFTAEVRALYQLEKMWQDDNLSKTALAEQTAHIVGRPIQQNADSSL